MLFKFVFERTNSFPNLLMFIRHHFIDQIDSSAASTLTYILCSSRQSSKTKAIATSTSQQHSLNQSTHLLRNEGSNEPANECTTNEQHQANMSNLASQRKLVEQLRQEASIDRKKVSQVCKELISFCEAHQQSDVLVSGFTSQKENPFKEKSGCLII